MTRAEPNAIPAETRLLTAAEELFCDRGRAGVSARDVAERAGAPKGLVFYHFGSMDGLFHAVLERYYAAHMAALGEALASSGTTRERMHRLVDAYLDFMAKNARYASLVQVELASASPHPRVEQSFAPLFAFVEEALAEAAPRRGPAATRQLFVTFQGAVLNWCTYARLLAKVLGGDPLGPRLLAERRAHVKWLVDLVLDALERDRA